MISPMQALLARTILGISQKEAAKQLGMSHQSLSAIEKGDRDTPTSRILDIQTFYEGAGVVFTPGGGVEPRSYGLMVLEGREGFAKFRLDVLAEVRKGKPDICISNADERMFDLWGAGEINDHYRGEMARLIAEDPSRKARSLVKRGDTHFPANRHMDYKWISKREFGQFPFYVYGQKTALLLWSQESIDIFVINHPKVAEHYRAQFNDKWVQADDPSK
jgi:transcriptional regulator with XRE-family HTH domain